jgi:hypothetical protein
MHVDSAPVHHSKITQTFLEHRPLMKLICLLYLAHISPLYFYLFEKTKRSLIGQQIPDEIDLLEIMIRIVDLISDEELQANFCSWIEYVQKVIDANEEY